MNIYIEINGVILQEDAELAKYADQFLQSVLSKYPTSTYWLLPQAETGAVTSLLENPYLSETTQALLASAQLLTWDELKTEAIELDKDFLWFGNEIWPDELKLLEDKNLSQQFVLVDLHKDPDMLEKLTTIF